MLAFGCKNKLQNKKDTSPNILSEKYTPLPNLYQISSKTKQKEINKWNKFKELGILTARFQKQESGDLSYYAEEFVRLNNEIVKDSLFPEKFKNSEIKSRLLVHANFTNQFKSYLEQNAPLDTLNISRTRILNTYNSLLKQLEESLKSKVYIEFIAHN